MLSTTTTGKRKQPDNNEHIESPAISIVVKQLADYLTSRDDLFLCDQKVVSRGAKEVLTKLAAQMSKCMQEDEEVWQLLCAGYWSLETQIETLDSSDKAVQHKQCLSALVQGQQSLLKNVQMCLRAVDWQYITAEHVNVVGFTTDDHEDSYLQGDDNITDEGLNVILTSVVAIYNIFSFVVPTHVNPLDIRAFHRWVTTHPYPSSLVLKPRSCEYIFVPRGRALLVYVKTDQVHRPHYFKFSSGEDGNGFIEQMTDQLTKIGFKVDGDTNTYTIDSTPIDFRYILVNLVQTIIGNRDCEISKVSEGVLNQDTLDLVKNHWLRVLSSAELGN